MADAGPADIVGVFGDQHDENPTPTPACNGNGEGILRVVSRRPAIVVSRLHRCRYRPGKNIFNAGLLAIGHICFWFFD